MCLLSLLLALSTIMVLDGISSCYSTDLLRYYLFFERVNTLLGDFSWEIIEPQRQIIIFFSIAVNYSCDCDNNYTLCSIMMRLQS